MCLSIEFDIEKDLYDNYMLLWYIRFTNSKLTTPLFINKSVKQVVYCMFRKYVKEPISHKMCLYIYIYYMYVLSK